jgi:putative phosphoribosyl transferase
MGRVKAKEVIIPANGAALKAFLRVPSKVCGVVAFAHGSGSGRLSPRNNFVADILHDAGIATLLADLLEEFEASDSGKVFDIGLLTGRLLACAEWLHKLPGTQGLPAGYFGASTGAAAALQAAARKPEEVAAIVSRGGRPDLAIDYLSTVQAPTLLIVGGMDHPVISLNELAYKELRCLKEMAIVPGATHLFEEPGALEKVAELARDWFVKYFPPRRNES